MNLQERQKDLYKKLRRCASKISGLSGYIQNDLSSCIDDNFMTVEDITAMSKELDEECDALIMELDVIRSEIISLLKEYES